MKRTLIPLSHRPYVKGSKVKNNDDLIFKNLKDAKFRRNIIIECLNGNGNSLKMCPIKVKKNFKIMYPNLSE